MLQPGDWDHSRQYEIGKFPWLGTSFLNRARTWFRKPSPTQKTLSHGSLNCAKLSVRKTLAVNLPPDLNQMVVPADNLNEFSPAGDMGNPESGQYCQFC